MSETTESDLAKTPSLIPKCWYSSNFGIHGLEPDPLENVGVHVDFVMMSPLRHDVAADISKGHLLVMTRNVCPTLVFMSSLSPD